MANTNRQINDELTVLNTGLQKEINDLINASQYFVTNGYIAEDIRSPQLDNAGMNESNAELLRSKPNLKNEEPPLKKSRKAAQQPVASGSTGTLFGGPPGASIAGPLELESMEEERNEATSKYQKKLVL